MHRSVGIAIQGRCCMFVFVTWVFNFDNDGMMGLLSGIFNLDDGWIVGGNG